MVRPSQDLRSHPTEASFNSIRQALQILCHFFIMLFCLCLVWSNVLIMLNYPFLFEEKQGRVWYYATDVFAFEAQMGCHTIGWHFFLLFMPYKQKFVSFLHVWNDYKLSRFSFSFFSFLSFSLSLFLSFSLSLFLSPLAVCQNGVIFSSQAFVADANWVHKAFLQYKQQQPLLSLLAFFLFSIPAVQEKEREREKERKKELCSEKQKCVYN